MRTLKKTLALVLVLAMMFSLCITASADFADQEDIQNELAVNVLTELKVINGMPDGTYDPAGTLTRAQAAKILCYMLGVAEFIEPCATDFTDVAESHWASGYIAYCADQGIIDGYGDGKFGPSDTLTGYAWAKMLLVAFDLVTDYEGDNVLEMKPVSLTGASWQILTAKYATAAGLWLGDTSSKKEACTRDNAALHAFNVLYGEKAAEIYGDVIGEDKLGYSLAEEVLVVDEFKAPVADVWYLYPVADQDAKYDDEDAIVVYSEAIDADFTYTAPTKRSAILKDLGAEDVADISFVIYEDGQLVESSKNGTTFGKDALDSEWTRTGYGATVKFYLEDKADTKDVTEYRVVVINTYFDKLADAKTDIIKADAEKKIKAGIMLDGVKYETEEAFAEGDGVLYTIADGKIQSAVKATVVTEKVSKYTDTTYVVAGETYTKAVKGEFAGVNFTDKFNLYVDGTIVYAVEKYVAPEQKPEETVIDGYAYVLEWQTVAGKTTAGDLFKDETSDAAAAKAKIVNLDGTISVVDLKVYTKEGDANKGKYFIKGVDGTEFELTADYTAKDVNTWGAYTVEEGVYNAETMKGAFVYDRTNTVKKTDRSIDGYYITDATTLTTINVADETVKTVTGYGKIELAANCNALIVVDAEAKTITAIYVVELDEAPETPAEPTTENYAMAVEAGATVEGGVEWTFYIGGEVKVLVVAEGKVPAAGSVYDLTINDKGVVTEIGEAKTLTERAKVTLINEAYFVAGSAINFAKDYVVYNITEGVAGTADTLEVNDYVQVIKNADGAAIVIYIVDAPAEA